MHKDRFAAVPPTTGERGIAHAIIEIPKGSRNKFEIDKETGLMRLDRYLYSASHYPGDYGFIPNTLAQDGDPLDILVMVNEPTFTGCLIEARVVGLFRMVDSGQNDFKILAVPNTDPFFDEYRTLEDVPKSYLKEVEHFFATYKQLEAAAIETLGWNVETDAMIEIGKSIQRYEERQASKAE
jgi:inorganic pyrophosphatase